MSGWRLAPRAISIVLILFGAGLMALAVGLYAYASYEQATVTSQFGSWYSDSPPPAELFAIGSEASAVDSTAEAKVDPDNAGSAAEPDPPSQAFRQSDTTPSRPGESLPPQTPSAAANPAPSPTPQPAPARWIRIPRIEVDSPVVEALIRNGEWEVPKFVAGHLQGTADPGEIGNVVLTGHVQSLTAGNVFARIGELEQDDKVFLYSGSSVLPYRVTKTFVVKNDDLSVVMPTPTPTLTLITCTGFWNPITRDYSERLIVVAEPISLND